MAIPSNITTGEQTVTTTGPVAPSGGVDISGVDTDCTVHLRVKELSALSGTPKVELQLEDSLDGFGQSIPIAVVHLSGSQVVDRHFSWRKYQIPGARFGAANAVLRWNVRSFEGSTPSLTLLSWLES